MTLMPVSAKSLVLRVARSAEWVRHIAAIWASANTFRRPRACTCRTWCLGCGAPTTSATGSSGEERLEYFHDRSSSYRVPLLQPSWSWSSEGCACAPYNCRTIDVVMKGGDRDGHEDRANRDPDRSDQRGTHRGGCADPAHHHLGVRARCRDR